MVVDSTPVEQAPHQEHPSQRVFVHQLDHVNARIAAPQCELFIAVIDSSDEDLLKYIEHLVLNQTCPASKKPLGGSKFGKVNSMHGNGEANSETTTWSLQMQLRFKQIGITVQELFGMDQKKTGMITRKSRAKNKKTGGKNELNPKSLVFLVENYNEL